LLIGSNQWPSVPRMLLNWLLPSIHRATGAFGAATGGTFCAFVGASGMGLSNVSASHSIATPRPLPPWPTSPARSPAAALPRPLTAALPWPPTAAALRRLRPCSTTSLGCGGKGPSCSNTFNHVL
jgi:hypothetical protein